MIASIIARPHARWFGDTRGAVAVELAITAPFLVLLVLGIIDFSNYMNNSQAIATATRVGAEYARDSTVCQNSTTGVNPLPSADVINTPCLSGDSTHAGIEYTMQHALPFSPTLTFPNMSTCSTSPSPCLVCDCDGTGTSLASCGVATCPTGTGPRRVYVRVSAQQTITSLLPWPGFPSTVSAWTTLRIR